MRTAGYSYMCVSVPDLVWKANCDCTSLTFDEHSKQC